MSLNVLYPDSRSELLDIEAKVFGADTTLLNPRKSSFAAIDLASWENCDGIVVARIQMDKTVAPHLKKCQIGRAHV